MLVIPDGGSRTVPQRKNGSVGELPHAVHWPLTTHTSVPYVEVPDAHPHSFKRVFSKSRSGGLGAADIGSGM